MIVILQMRGHESTVWVHKPWHGCLTRYLGDNIRRTHVVITCILWIYVQDPAILDYYCYFTHFYTIDTQSISKVKCLHCCRIFLKPFVLMYYTSTYQIISLFINVAFAYLHIYTYKSNTIYTRQSYPIRWDYTSP